MSWKKAVFLGGAVLLLAACGESATAPNSLVRGGGPAAAAKANGAPTPKVGNPTLLDDCENAFVKWGRDTSCTAVAP